MAQGAVVSAVEAYLGATFSSVPVRYPNDAGGETPADASAFIEVQFPIANNRHVGMAAVGNRTFREEGIIRIVLSAVRGQGLDQALVTCDALMAFFLAKQFGGVTTRTPNAPVTDDSNDNGNYWVLSIAVPYFYDYLG